jgi:hypothetical protein
MELYNPHTAVMTHARYLIKLGYYGELRQERKDAAR